MHVVEIFIPLTASGGESFPAQRFEAERQTLTSRFGGLTVYSRAPAAGFWAHDDKTVRDDIVIFEVLAETIDAGWWTSYREHLERQFRQERILIRAAEVTIL